jgi:hypothetical protein
MKTDSHRFEIFLALMIAVVSLTTALAAWRTDTVGSNADDINRQGMIDALKKQAGANLNWQLVYQQAGFARDHAVALAAVEVLESSDDAAANAQAANMRQFILPSLRDMAAPLATEKKYTLETGGLDLSLYFADLQAEMPDLSGLDPRATFDQADLYYGEQRWLTVGAVLLAISLFWLALAELGGKKSRLATTIIGIGVYLLGLAWYLGVELITFIIRAGAS